MASLVELASLCPKIQRLVHVHINTEKNTTFHVILIPGTSYEGTFWCAAAARPSSTRQVFHKQERTRVQGTGASKTETRDNHGQLPIALLAGSPCIGGCISEVVRSRPSKNHVKTCSAGRLASRPPIPCGKRRTKTCKFRFSFPFLGPKKVPKTFLTNGAPQLRNYLVPNVVGVLFIFKKRSAPAAADVQSTNSRFCFTV